MGQNKLERFSQLKQFENVLEYPGDMQGKWSNFFKNSNPVVLELACGKGEYALGLGRMYKDRNFIGVDVKGNRLWRGAKTALDQGLHNVAFLRTQIDRIDTYFAKDEIDEIWITFPDPQLRLSKIRKRLTHPKFLRKYAAFLKPGGLIHLKTDSPDLYNFTKTVVSLYNLQLVEDFEDVQAAVTRKPELDIKTHYEGLDIAQSNKIHYLLFKLAGNLSMEKDEELKDLFREKGVEGGR